MGHVALLFPKTGRERPREEILPLGLLYLAAPLVQAGYDITILDQRKCEDWRARLGRALGGPRPLAVGISAMTGGQIRHGIEMAGAVRDMSPGVPIVWGGVHPSLLPEQTAECPLVDIVVVGEGEASFPPLVAALEAGRDWRRLPGLCFRHHGRVVRTGPPPAVDLEALPPLPYELVDLDRYRIRPLRSAGPSLPIVTSRGCAFVCGYCYNAEFYQCQWRGLSPARVLEELTRLATRHHAEGVFLLDDNFFGSRRRAEEILRLLIDSGLGIDLYNANCRVDFLHRSSEGSLRLMRRSGIRQLFIGVESGSDRLLKKMRKGITVGQVLEVNRRLRDAGIVPVYSFMAGLPDETWDEVQRTLELMAQLRQENPQARLYKTSLYLPMPGTELFQRCRDLGSRFPERLEDWASYDYDHVNLRLFPDSYRRQLERVSQLSGFLDVEGKLGGPLRFVARAYSKVATFRCRRRLYGWMPELAAVQLFRRCMKR